MPCRVHVRETCPGCRKDLRPRGKRHVGGASQRPARPALVSLPRALTSCGFFTGSLMREGVSMAPIGWAEEGLGRRGSEVDQAAANRRESASNANRPHRGVGECSLAASAEVSLPMKFGPPGAFYNLHLLDSISIAAARSSETAPRALRSAGPRRRRLPAPGSSIGPSAPQRRSAKVPGDRQEHPQEVAHRPAAATAAAHPDSGHGSAWGAWGAWRAWRARRR